MTIEHNSGGNNRGENKDNFNTQEQQRQIICDTKDCLKTLLKDKDIQMYSFAMELLKLSISRSGFTDDIDKLVIPEGYKGEYIGDWLEDIKKFFPKESYREKRWGKSRGLESLTKSIIIKGMHSVGTQKWEHLEANSDKLRNENQKEIEKQSLEGLIHQTQEKELSQKHEVYVQQWLAANRYRHTETQLEYDTSNIKKEQKEWLQEVPPLFAQEWLLNHKQRVEKLKTYQYIDIYQRLEALHMYDTSQAISYISKINSVTKRIEEYNKKGIIDNDIYAQLKKNTDTWEVNETLDIYNDIYDQLKKGYVPNMLKQFLYGDRNEVQRFLLRNRDKVAYIELAFTDGIIDEKQRDELYFYDYTFVIRKLRNYYRGKGKRSPHLSYLSQWSIPKRKQYIENKGVSQPIYENSAFEHVPESIFIEIKRKKGGVKY